MEIDPQAVFDRLAIRGEDIPLSEQNVTQLYQQVKEQVKWSLFKWRHTRTHQSLRVDAIYLYILLCEQYDFNLKK